MNDILIVDDEKDIRLQLAGILEDEGYSVRKAADSTEFFESLCNRFPSLVILDIWLKRSEFDGMEILLKMQKYYPDLPVIIISGHGTIEIAVRAMRSGAFSFLEKPLKIDHLLLLVKRAIGAHKTEITTQNTICPFSLLGSSDVLNTILLAAKNNAPYNSRVFISGQRGTGKKSLAHYIHQNSLYKDGNFIHLPLENMPIETIETALFGMGDRSGEQLPKMIGALEKAHNGTLYISGIDQLPKNLQAKLTKFLVDKSYIRPFSDTQKVDCEVRLITSNHGPLKKIISSDMISKDLLNRLIVVPIEMPSICERPQDLHPILLAMKNEIEKKYHISLPPLSQEIIQNFAYNLHKYNIPLLFNHLEYILLSQSVESNQSTQLTIPDPISLDTQSRNITNPLPELIDPFIQMLDLPLREARESFERNYLMQQLEKFGGNISKTAHFIGMERSALHRKMRSLGISGRYEKDVLQEG